MQKCVARVEINREPCWLLKYRYAGDAVSPHAIFIINANNTAVLFSYVRIGMKKREFRRMQSRHYAENESIVASTTIASISATGDGICTKMLRNALEISCVY